MVVLRNFALLKIVVELKELYVTMRTWNSYHLLPPFPWLISILCTLNLSIKSCVSFILAKTVVLKAYIKVSLCIDLINSRSYKIVFLYVVLSKKPSQSSCYHSRCCRGEISLRVSFLSPVYVRQVLNRSSFSGADNSSRNVLTLQTALGSAMFGVC